MCPDTGVSSVSISTCAKNASSLAKAGDTRATRWATPCRSTAPMWVLSCLVLSCSVQRTLNTPFFRRPLGRTLETLPGCSGTNWGRVRRRKVPGWVTSLSRTSSLTHLTAPASPLAGVSPDRSAGHYTCHVSQVTCQAKKINRITWFCLGQLCSLM